MLFGGSTFSINIHALNSAICDFDDSHLEDQLIGEPSLFEEQPPLKQLDFEAEIFLQNFFPARSQESCC